MVLDSFGAFAEEMRQNGKVQRYLSQRNSATNCFGPSGEMISKFKLRVVGDGVEIVVAVDQTGQTLLDDVEERVERRECRVLGIGHDLLLGCCVS